MRRALLLTLIFLTSFAHAVPTISCSLVIPSGEVAEAKIDFEKALFDSNPHHEDQAVGIADLKFPKAKVGLQVEVHEFVQNGKLHWAPALLKLSDGKISVRASGENLEFDQDGAAIYQVDCDAFANTGELKEFAGSDREKMRLDLLGGPGASREYAEARELPDNFIELERIVTYDLYRQLLRVPGFMGDILRKTQEDIGNRGGRVEFVGPGALIRGKFKTLRKSVSCSDDRSTYTCDVEHFEISVNYGFRNDTENETKNAEQADGELSINVEGLIERESSTRLIKKYRITSVSVTEPNWEHGGSVSSGGRLNGGN